jgi:hypothetical protein
VLRVRNASKEGKGSDKSYDKGKNNGKSVIRGSLHCVAR